VNAALQLAAFLFGAFVTIIGAVYLIQLFSGKGIRK